MQAPLKDKNDIKIFILYLLRHIGYPLDFVSINDIVVQDGFVSYFDFAECFAELLETGNVEELNQDGQEVYLITEQGRHVADTLESRLVHMLRDKSLKSAMRLLSFRKRGSDIRCEIEMLDGGKCVLHCAIIECREEVLKVSVTLDSVEQAQRMKYNFDSKPETLYKGVLALLSGEVNYLIS